MRREWDPEQLIDCWTLVEDDWALVANKSGPTRPGFAALLKSFEVEGRFPRHAGVVPKLALGYLAGQLKVPAEVFADYEWTGRTIEYHRAQIRKALVRPFAEPGRLLGRNDRPSMCTWWAEFTIRSRIDSATTGFGFYGPLTNTLRIH